MPLFCRIRQDLADIWPDPLRSSQISSDLMGFQVVLRQGTPNTSFCKFPSKNLRISPKVFGFMIGSGGSGLGRKPANQSEGVKLCGWRPTTNRWSGQFGGFLVQVRAGWLGLSELVGFSDWVDNPTFNTRLKPN